MKKLALLVAIFAACGGGQKPAPEPAAPPPAPAPVAEPAPPPEPATPPAPPEPKVSKAKAELTPVKGQKFKPATITLAQPEGGVVAIASTGWFDGLKAGTYHLVVHEGTDCAKAGNAYKPAATVDMTFKAEKDSGNVDLSGVKVSVMGDEGVTGHTLVLTDDKKGKPGKTIACGPIVADGE